MLKAILIDDEKNNRDALRKKIETNCTGINIVAEAGNGIEGIAAIEKFKPEVVFLDIEMPHMNGLTMLEQVPEKNFEIIFTTAYNQYAINAIRLGAFDYLVKPVDVTELVVVTNRLMEKRQRITQKEQFNILLHRLADGNNRQPQKIAIATMEGMEIVLVENIVYMEAAGNYTQIYFNTGKPMIASKTLKDFEDLLEGSGFFRIHNASLINLVFVKKYIKGDGGQVLLSNGTVLDVARRRKEELIEMLLKIAPKV